MCLPSICSCILRSRCRDNANRDKRKQGCHPSKKPAADLLAIKIKVINVIHCCFYFIVLQTIDALATEDRCGVGKKKCMCRTKREWTEGGNIKNQPGIKSTLRYLCLYYCTPRIFRRAPCKPEDRSESDVPCWPVYADAKDQKITMSNPLLIGIYVDQCRWRRDRRQKE